MADPDTTSNTQESQSKLLKPAKRKGGRWLRRGMFLGAVLGGLVWFAPVIVAKTQLRHQLPKLLFPTYPGEMEFGELSLLWTTPVLIKDVKINDDEGRPLLSATQFSTSAPLWKIVTQPGNLGTLKLIDPVVSLQIGDHDSNLERVIRKYSEHMTSASRSSDFAIEIENGTIELVHEASNRQSTIEAISLRLASNRGAIDELDLAIGHVPGAGSEDVANTNWLAARYGLPSAEQPAPGTRKTKQAEFRASHWKLDQLAPLLARIDSNSDLSGELNADATFALTMTDLGPEWDWNGTTGIDRLMVSSSQFLHRDKLALESVRLSGRAVANSGRLAMHELKLTTDVGDLAATGDVPMEIQWQKSTTEILQSLLSDEDYHLDGRIDLKKLSALLPQTLRIRNDSEITAGEVTLQLVGVNTEGVRRWSGIAGVAGLKALNRGQVISWDKPLQASVNAHRDGKAIVVDLVDCKSDFLQVSGKGTLEDARFAATGDLSKLLENLERFVDLGLEQLSGQMQANGELRRQSDDQVSLNSKIVLNNFAYVVSQEHVWREQHLELTMAATGKTDAGPTLMKIESGEVQLQSAGDRLMVLLKQPVDLKASMPTYVANVVLNGNLASWQSRLRPLLAIDQWRLAGGVDLAAGLTIGAESIDVGDLKMALQKLVAAGPAWLIEEPDLKVATTGRWDRHSRTWKSPKLSASGNVLSVDLTDFEYGLGTNGRSRLSGQAKYRADLAQLSAWKNRAIPNPTTYLIGSLSGTASLTRQDNLLRGDVDAQVEKFIVAGPGVGANGQPQWVALWKEPVVQLSGKGAYDESRDQLNFETSRFGVENLSLAAKGSLEGCSTSQRIDLTGDLSYDWDQLTKRFGPQISQQVQLSGKDHRPFTLSGSLAQLSTQSVTSTTSIPATAVSFQPGSQLAGATASRDQGLSGKFGIGWATANIYGFAMGPADVSAQCEHGVCRFSPLDLAVNEGQLHLAPVINVGQAPMLLTHPSGKIIDQINLTPELCHNGLKYAAPILADTTQVDGKLSLEMQTVALPLSSPASGSANGVLTIHRAQSRPGPLGLQITSGIEQLKSIISRKAPADPNRDQVWIEMSEQQIPIRLEQGRVYHQGMTFMIKDVMIRTSGSVGIDSSLNLVAEVPVREEWLGNNKVLAGLKGKTIQIPISGTSSRPQIDPAFFANFAQQIGGSALEGLLQDKVGGDLNNVINNGLDKLLRGKK